MRPRNLVFITLLVLCHLQLGGQTLTIGLPPAEQTPAGEGLPVATAQASVPEDPGQELLPLAQPEPMPATGQPVRVEALRQVRAGDTLTLTGDVVVYYRDYVLRADKAVYHQSTSELEAEGHLQVTGGPDDVLIEASHGDLRIDMHTARFFNVNGSIGVRNAGRNAVYSTANPFIFSGRVLIQAGEGNYHLIDGRMTNCRLPKPDWVLISRSIDLVNGKASTSNSIFKFLGVPLFYLPYLRHPVEETGRESGFLIPVLPSNKSTIRGYTLGEQVYWVINRSMDMVVGSDYYSKRGWAPNGDFRYKGPGLDHLVTRWNALLDRGVEQVVAATATQPATTTLVNQGGVDIRALGRKDLSPDTRVAVNVEYLSSYVYRLVFEDLYSQAISSEVASNISLTHQGNGLVPSISFDRFQTFASATKGDEVRTLHLPSLRYDILDRPLGASPLTWGLGSSLAYLGRSEPHFHARNVGRLDFYPHLSLPVSGGGWSAVPEVAFRDSFYTISQNPDFNTAHPSATPYISHDPLNRADLEAAVDLRPPAMERDFMLTHWNRVLRHVIEPELTYRYVGGIGAQAQHVLLIDTTDIATNTNEVGYSLTQRFYLRSSVPQACADDSGQTTRGCTAKPREWASWQVAQKYFFDPDFGGRADSRTPQRVRLRA